MKWKKKLGEDKIHIYRRSWDILPKPLNKNNPYHPLNIEIYKDIPKDKIPDTESLKDTYDRVIPYFKKKYRKKNKWECNDFCSWKLYPITL